MLKSVYSTYDFAEIRQGLLLEVIKASADVSKMLVQLMEGGCLAGGFPWRGGILP